MSVDLVTTIITKCTRPKPIDSCQTIQIQEVPVQSKHTQKKKAYFTTDTDTGGIKKIHAHAKVKFHSNPRAILKALSRLVPKNKLWLHRVILLDKVFTAAEFN